MEILKQQIQCEFAIALVKYVHAIYVFNMLASWIEFQSKNKSIGHYSNDKYTLLTIIDHVINGDVFRKNDYNFSQTHNAESYHPTPTS